MTVKELLERIDSRELTEWMMFSRIENEDLPAKKKDNNDENLTDQLKSVFAPYKNQEYVDAITKGKRK